MPTPIDILNSTEHTGTFLLVLLVVLGIWCLLWRLFIGEWLRKHEVSTFWYAMYEAGPVGTFGLALMSLIVLAFPITSVQRALAFDGKVALAICAFWGGLAAVVFFIIKAIRK